MLLVSLAAVLGARSVPLKTLQIKLHSTQYPEAAAARVASDAGLPSMTRVFPPAGHHEHAHVQAW